MPSPRWLSLITLSLLLAGCDDRSLQQRADEIRQFSSREDRAYAAEALQHIQHTYWTCRGHAWFGKLPDGSFVRLDSPKATAAPLPSRAFYRGWHLQLTITSADWRSDPAAPHDQPFETVYAITRYSATNWDIRVSDGHVTSPLLRQDALRLQGDGVY